MEYKWTPIRSRDQWSLWCRKHGHHWNTRPPEGIKFPFGVHNDFLPWMQRAVETSIIEGNEITNLFHGLWPNSLDGG